MGGEASLSCHSEGAKRPKNLITTSKYKILRCAQDDKMAIRRGLNSIENPPKSPFFKGGLSKGCRPVSPFDKGG